LPPAPAHHPHTKPDPFLEKIFTNNNTRLVRGTIVSPKDTQYFATVYKALDNLALHDLMEISHKESIRDFLGRTGAHGLIANDIVPDIIGRAQILLVTLHLSTLQRTASIDQSSSWR
jgi:hypothetical protein